MKTSCIILLLIALLPLNLQADHPEPSVLFGADISMLPRFEELGAVYSDGGAPGDLIQILRSKGMNSFRVRLFVNPNMENAVLQDLSYVIDLAKRVRAANAILLLDLHYSDTWADPGHQTKPAAWSDLTFSELESRVYEYTRDVLSEMKRENCLPQMVQLGNEISSGMLWPEGRLWVSPHSWDHFIALLQAGVKAVEEFENPRPEVLIHYDNGGDSKAASHFFCELREREVNFEHIGLSYYPWWHGNMEDLEKCLSTLAMEFGKPVHVVETAYPWRGWSVGGPGAWSASPEGQHEFLAELLATLQSTPRGLGGGLFWWYPEAIPIQGLDVWEDGRNGLFDNSGASLPALDAFGGGGK
jgi:arabinogalactan endo-1,4-beta-galactosidase